MTTRTRSHLVLRWLVLVALALVLGLVSAAPQQAIHADFMSRDGYNNLVLEITAAAGGVDVHSTPSQTGARIDTLWWGDRVLWTGEAATAEGYRWIKVGIGSGSTGWMQDTPGWTIEMDPVYTTPGMGSGARVQVTSSGAGSHCRDWPSSEATEVEMVDDSDMMTVVGGPYQAEYWMWWEYRLANRSQCWIVDVPGWFRVVTPGTF
ncbi:MAG: SH3 domain-containing protein [Anaerolineae bacterium]|nr:SH3 domain-containing protein [Anaerolineae bacterium]